MDKKVLRIINRTVIVLLAALTVFAAATFFLCKNSILAIVEGSIVLVLLVISIISLLTKSRRLSSYIESVVYETDSARNSTLMNFPLPIAVFRLENSGLIWGNDLFFKMCGIDGSRLDACVNDYIPQFSSKWLLEGKTSFGSLLEINGRKYRLHGNIIRSEETNSGNAYMGITYWVDVTEYDNIRIEYQESRPVAGIIVIDNLDELYRNQPERERNDIRDSIEDTLNQWGSEHSAILRRYERDRYIAVFERRDVDKMISGKFAVVEDIHKVENPAGIPASISIGLGVDAENFSDALQLATNAMELAISRGGDQAVIKNKHGYEFFGGRGDEVEKRTKVKSRVMANAFADMIRDASGVYAMGHKLADLDSVGAAAGVVCLARKLGVDAKIVMGSNSNAANLITRLKSNEQYADRFITPREAMLHADSRTLLVVVDNNRPEQTEDSDLLESCTKVVVVDHHRVGATYIQNAALSFIEPYASSASELMTEMLQEIVDRQDILKCEAEALLAGMVLDTKNFTVRTGERSFEAAAYLRRAGADTSAVKKLMQSDMDTTVARYNVLRSAKLYRNIALAAPTTPQTRIVAAQAADELLNISGVDASVVIAPDGKGGAFASARSIGKVNVQILMEKLGGGGNRSVAAAQFENMTIERLDEKVKAAIDDYFDKA